MDKDNRPVSPVNGTSSSGDPHSGAESKSKSPAVVSSSAAVQGDAAEPPKGEKSDLMSRHTQSRLQLSSRDKPGSNSKKAGPRSGEAKDGREKGVTIKLGDALEYRVMRLYAFQGYFVRRGRVIYTVGKLDQATDLDVLAIKHSDLFRRETVVCECKSGGEGPLDRVFWLSGVKRYVRADRAFLIRKPTKWNIKDFAKEAGVEILDLDHLADLETAFGIGANDWPGLSDLSFLSSHVDSWNEVLRHDSYLSEMYLTFAGEVRFEEPFGAINFWLHHMRSLTREYKTPYESRRSLVSYLLTEAASQLAVFLTRVAAQSVDLSEQDRKGLIVKRLTYGELEPSLAERLLGRAHQLAQQAATHYVNGPVTIDKSLFTMPIPDYTSDVCSMVEKMIVGAPLTGTLAPLTDLVLAESLLKENRAMPWVKKMFRHSDYPSRLTFVRNFLEFLVDLSCLPRVVLSSFYTEV